MSMGTREDGKQPPIWVEASEVARGEGHVFYRRLNELLRRHGFDAFVEKQVLESRVFAEGVGRPSIPPGTYFRMMFAGFFEGLPSERAIAWRCADSFSLREFLGFTLTEATPDHSTLSGLRRRLPEALHREVFGWVLKVAAEEGLLKGRKVAIDATTLEANAAMRTIVRRADGASYQKYLKKLARAEGIKNPTPQDLGRMDRKRKGKKVSNKDWKSPSDPDARITKMKDGTTHLAHKAEHAVDLDSGVIVAAEIHPADSGDTATLPETLDRAQAAVQRANPDLSIEEIVADCGYHSAQTLGDLDRQGYMTCIPERRSKRRRRWKRLAREVGPEEARRRQRAFYENRRRLKSPLGKRLLGRRGETIERSFAHVCETGAMRRLYLRGRANISKRYQLHVGATNLGILLRSLIGTGTPRGFQGRKGLLHAILHALSSSLRLSLASLNRQLSVPGILSRFDSGTFTASLLASVTPSVRLSAGCYPDEVLRSGFPGLSSVISKKVQDVELELFQRLTADDILFIDSSHVVKTGGDVTYLFLEVLPRLQPGVVVHVHDIFLPQEFPKSWVQDLHLFWTEQYLLHAFLTYNSEFEVLFANAYMGVNHLQEMQQTFPQSPWWGGGSFWMRRHPATDDRRRTAAG